jgi:hypothetical protein
VCQQHALPGSCSIAALYLHVCSGWRVPTTHSGGLLHSRCFVSPCVQWLACANSTLRRAAAQSLGLLAEVEGKRFVSRLWSSPAPVPAEAAASSLGPGHRRAGPFERALIVPVLACLQRAAAACVIPTQQRQEEQQSVGEAAAEGQEGGAGWAVDSAAGGTCQGWHEAYYCLVLLEKVGLRSGST